MRLSTMRTMCKVAYQGVASTRRTIAGTGKPVPLLCGERAQEPECRVSFSPFRQGQQCIWPEYPSLRNAWAFSFRCAGIGNAGEVGMWAKKKTGDRFPGFRFILRLRTILDAQSLFQPITEHLREIETFFFCQII